MEEINDSIEKVKLLIIQNSDDFEEYVENHGRDTEECEDTIWGEQQKRLYKELDDLIELKSQLK